MKILLKTKLIVSLLSVVFISGLISTVVGVKLIGNTIVRQAQDKVRLDLISAREVYYEASKDIKDVIRFLAIRFFLKYVPGIDLAYVVRCIIGAEQSV